MTSIKLYDDIISPMLTQTENLLQYLQSVEDLTLKTNVQQIINNDYDNINNNEVNLRKSKFKNEGIVNIQYLYLILIFCYIVTIIYCGFILYKKDLVSPIKKISIIILLFIIPVISTRVLLFILQFIQDFYNKMPKNVNVNL